MTIKSTVIMLGLMSLIRLSLLTFSRSQDSEVETSRCFGDVEFTYGNVQTTVFLATRHCEDRGATLARIGSLEEFNHVQQLLREVRHYGVLWIGIFLILSFSFSCSQCRRVARSKVVLYLCRAASSGWDLRY